MDMKYNKKNKHYFKVICSKCGLKREIYRIGCDNTKSFYCVDCMKHVKPKIKSSKNNLN
jgi:hypothetical protein